MRVMQIGQTLMSLGLVLTLGGALGAQDGGIEIFAGETLFSHGTRVSVAHLFSQKSDLYAGSDTVADPTNAKQREHRMVLGYNYGWTPRVTVGALIPAVARRSEFIDMGGPASLSSRGLGDVALFGKYRLFTRDAYRKSFNISVIAGLETPTGATGERDGGQRLAASQQPGSGSWDPFFAIAATSSYGRWRIDGQIFYKANNQGSQDFEDSDLFAVGISAAYRYLHRPYPGASNAARIGLVWHELGSARQGGAQLANSGASRLILRTGLGFHPRPAIDISFNFDLPLYQNYDGAQLGLDYRTFLAFGYRF
jgi:hypothetical protein